MDSKFPELLPRLESDEEGAGRRIRTDDLLITNQLLYQLSYAGILRGTFTLSLPRGKLNPLRSVRGTTCFGLH
jgi:hypothetical protein